VSTTSKSPKAVLQVAYLVGLTTLRRYAHHNSPKKFTQPQLFACLVLKEFLQLDYRKLSALLVDVPDLCRVIDLLEVPHFTTFQKAARRLLQFAQAERLLDKTLRLAQVVGRLPARIPLAAGDGTGWESHHASQYYVKRRASCSKYWQKITYKTFPKAGVLCDTASHLILAVVPEQGPGPDIKHFRPLLDQALRRLPLEALALDAGYDAEHAHRYAREERRVRTLIPAKIGRRTDKPPSGYWRRKMSERLHLTRYTQRWQAETVNSMLKRLMGSALRARNYWTRCRETFLRAISLHVMILKRRKVFYGACQEPYLPFLGLPRGRMVVSSPSRRTAFSLHDSSPNGLPRWMLRRIATSSASVCGALTNSTQFGRRGKGQAANSALSSAVPRCQRARLLHCHCSARRAKSARNGFRSM